MGHDEEPQLSPQDSQDQPCKNHDQGQETPSDNYCTVENDQPDVANLSSKENTLPPLQLSPTQANPQPVPWPPEGGWPPHQAYPASPEQGQPPPPFGQPQAYLPPHRIQKAFGHLVGASMGYQGPSTSNPFSLLLETSGASMEYQGPSISNLSSLLSGASMGYQGPSTPNSFLQSILGTEGQLSDLIDEAGANMGNQEPVTSNLTRSPLQAVGNEGRSNDLIDRIKETGASIGNQGPGTSNLSQMPLQAVGNEGRPSDHLIDRIDEAGANTGNQGASISKLSPIPLEAVWTEGWSSDLFDCMDEPQNAIITACFPCVTYGRIAEIVDNDQSTCLRSGLLYGLVVFLTGCPWILSFSVRSKLRNRYKLDESPLPDWITHCCCELCALCQEYRELNNQGLDPSLGWQGNVVKQQQNVEMQHQATISPPMNQTMM